MLSTLIAIATVQAAVPATPASSRRLHNLPGIAITYHDLTEKDVKTINKALSKKKPLTPAQQALLGASTNWGVSPSVTKLTKGASCTVTKSQIEFKPTADLPRFNEEFVPVADQAAWRSYLAATEAQAAAKLWFAYDRLSTFEQAVVGKPCAQAMTDGVAAINKLKAEAAAFQPPIEASQGAPAPLPAGAARPAAPKTAAQPAPHAPPPVQSPGGY